ncbi:MAG: alpha/beta hydrolase [Rhodoferax sp.]|nr:alpha/beta hydrolase [Rhodoferax sp.]
MKFTISSWAAVGASLLVAACGGGGSSSGSAGTQNSAPARGELMQSPPPRITSLTAADYNASLSASAAGQGLLALSTGSATGSLPCGIDVQYIKYGTVGGQGEATTASAALIVPTGTDPACTGPRPIVLHAHGTAVEKRYNLADFADRTNPAFSEASVLGAIYAAQGYIVVAPNYAGYDSSTLGYHPYLVLAQQTKDMTDALVAAKAALPTLLAGTTTNGKVFLSGYSQGGSVALATHKAMITDPTTVAKLASLSLTVKASAQGSGPYALQSLVDQIMQGAVSASSTYFAPLLLTGYQKSYGVSAATNLYTSTSDVYESTYATGIEANFPGAYSYTTLVTSGKVPQAALFDTASLPAAPAGALNALWTAGFGTPNLIKSSFRTDYLTNPANQARANALVNDLRSMTSPVGATLLCGGSNDPTVYYASNTGAMLALPIWAGAVTSGAVREVNMDLGAGTANPLDPFGALKTSFTASNPTSGANYASTYHANLLPDCVRAARGFFALVP